MLGVGVGLFDVSDCFRLREEDEGVAVCYGDFPGIFQVVHFVSRDCSWELPEFSEFFEVLCEDAATEDVRVVGG